MSKHTPGPWIIGSSKTTILNNSKTGTFGALASTHYGEQIDGTGNYGFTHEEAMANARLISIAPEMLDWLKSLEDYERSAEDAEALIRSIVIGAQKLIAKAEGEVL